MTRLYLNAGNGTPTELHLRFIQSAADGLSVDWGDGSAPETYPMNGGRPLKRDYRKFKMKEIDGPDDYGSMREAVGRGFQRLMDGDLKFCEVPDLLLIDGGSVHAAAARDTLRELGLELPVYGMVKDDKHRTRALTSPDGAEIGISGNPAVFALIGTIQEETHRFAIEYQRSLRTAKLHSALDDIKGVGEKRKTELMKHFGTIKAIKAASLEELEKAVPKNTAKAVYEHYHGGGRDE